jgi:hypothetical protein
MTLDTIDGTVYVQIILNEWSSFIKINPSIAINTNATHFRTVAKLGTGVSGFELSKINTFLKLVNPDWTELATAGNASSKTLAKYQVKIAKIDDVGYIQVAGQETTNWSAVTGDTLWIGKVYFEDKTAPTAPGNLTANVDSTTVTLKWDASTDNATIGGYVVSQDGTVLDTIKTKRLKLPIWPMERTPSAWLQLMLPAINHRPVRLKQSFSLCQLLFNNKVLKDLKFIQIRLLQPCR